MKQKIEEKLKAIKLRERGYSLNEIVEKIKVAKSSVSVWVRNVFLSSVARKRLLTKIKRGQLIAAEQKRKKNFNVLKKYHAEALLHLADIRLDKNLSKIICSLIYWCEGAKSYYYGVNFINSDPRLVKIFLLLLRKSFNLDEEKFRICVHLHNYHNMNRQIDFWSKITKISKKQFIKPFLKSNTGKIIRKNYQGCIAIRYHSNDLAKQLLMTADAFLSKYGGIG